MSLPFEFSVEETPPDLIFAYVSPRSRGGVSITEADVTAAESAEPFFSDDDVASTARHEAEESGLSITAGSRLGFTVAGPPEAYTELTGGSVVARELLQRTEMGRSRYVTHLDIVGPDQPADLGVGSVRGGDAIEAVILERPRSSHAVFPSPLPPDVTKFHLTLPGDVSGLLGAGPAQRDGASGDGVTVAMVDTGQYAHPYFAFHGYRVQPAVAVVPGTNPAKDPVGHGTGESANIFAVAPAATLQPYRASDNNGNLTRRYHRLPAGKGRSSQRAHQLLGRRPGLSAHRAAARGLPRVGAGDHGRRAAGHRGCVLRRQRAFLG